MVIEHVTCMLLVTVALAWQAVLMLWCHNLSILLGSSWHDYSRGLEGDSSVVWWKVWTFLYLTPRESGNWRLISCSAISRTGCFHPNAEAGYCDLPKLSRCFDMMSPHRITGHARSRKTPVPILPQNPIPFPQPVGGNTALKWDQIEKSWQVENSIFQRMI